jgi:hypothetical protein
MNQGRPGGYPPPLERSAARHAPSLPSPWPPVTTVNLNHSYPLHAVAEDFDLFAHDPRPIDADLEMTGIDWDPRMNHSWWLAMERRFGIQRGPDQASFQVKHLFTTSERPTRPDGVSNRGGADVMLTREAEEWDRMFGNGNDTLIDTSNKDDPVEDVFGFWLFPANAFGEVIADFATASWTCHFIVDMKQHRPQLGAFCLP